MTYIEQPDMDVYKFIDYDDGYSRLDHLDGLGHQPDLAAMNLHDAAEYQARHARIAHPHYKRHGRIDAVTGEWVPFTTDELADMKADRKWRWALIGVYSMVVVGLAVAVVLIILKQNGVLS